MQLVGLGWGRRPLAARPTACGCQRLARTVRLAASLKVAAAGVLSTATKKLGLGLAVGLEAAEVPVVEAEPAEERASRSS